MKFLLGLIGLGLLLTACGTDNVEQPPVSAESSSSINSSEEPTAFIAPKKAGNGGYYFLRGNDVPAGKALLFFAQVQDPFSQKNDQLLRAWYQSGGVVTNTYYVNYDAALPLRMQLGVVTYNTFVKMDAEGVRVKSIVHPTEDELRGLLK